MYVFMFVSMYVCLSMESLQDSPLLTDIVGPGGEGHNFKKAVAEVATVVLL